MSIAAEPLAEGWETRLLRAVELEPFSERELALMRNQIFARHGYVFNAEELDTHFRAESWYKPDPKFKPERLSKTEKKNVELLRQAENDRFEKVEEPPHSPYAQVLVGRWAMMVGPEDNTTLKASPTPLRIVLERPPDPEDPKYARARVDVYNDTTRRRIAKDDGYDAGPALNDLKTKALVLDDQYGSLWCVEYYVENQKRDLKCYAIREHALVEVLKETVYWRSSEKLTQTIVTRSELPESQNRPGPPDLFCRKALMEDSQGYKLYDFFFLRWSKSKYTFSGKPSYPGYLEPIRNEDFN